MAYDTASSCSFLEVMMAENPMISLVLYYFSADLKTTVFAEADGGPATWGEAWTWISRREDILNRLPHIEYRCLSSCPLPLCVYVLLSCAFLLAEVLLSEDSWAGCMTQSSLGTSWRPRPRQAGQARPSSQREVLGGIRRTGPGVVSQRIVSPHFQSP